MCAVFGISHSFADAIVPTLAAAIPANRSFLGDSGLPHKVCRTVSLEYQGYADAPEPKPAFRKKFSAANLLEDTRSISCGLILISRLIGSGPFSTDDNRAMHSSIYSDRSMPREYWGQRTPEIPFRICSAFATDYEGLSVILAVLDNL
jgi:hypothetical protein